MGELIYNNKTKAILDDRVLAHIEPVIWSKLRRREVFAFSWAEERPHNPHGQQSVWISGDISLCFQYYGSRVAKMNPAWIEALMRAANSPGGLRIVPEP